MSLQRTALRLGIIGSIKADPALASLLGGRVYDSRIAALDSQDPVPVLLVATEADGGPAYSSNNGGPDFNRSCDLTIEIALRVAEADTDIVGVPVTDARAEALIDFIEHRIVGSKDDFDNPGALNASNPYAQALRAHVVRRVAKVESHRHVDDRTGDKYAIRSLELTCELKTSGNENAAPALTGALALLPASLRAIAALDPAGAAGIAAILAGSPPPAATPFTGVDLDLGVGAAGVPVTGQAAADGAGTNVQFPTQEAQP